MRVTSLERAVDQKVGIIYNHICHLKTILIKTLLLGKFSGCEDKYRKYFLTFLNFPQFFVSFEMDIILAIFHLLSAVLEFLRAPPLVPRVHPMFGFACVRFPLGYPRW